MPPAAVRLATVLTLVSLVGCSPDPGEDPAETWPLSEVEPPPAPEEAAEVADSSSLVVVQDPASAAALAERSAAVATRPPVGSAAEVVDGGSELPDPDPDSGPMIHPPRTEPRVFEDARFPRPEHVRGLYLNAWASGSSGRVEDLLALARETEVNAFVIDIKDATGYVSHTTSVPLADEIGANGERRIRDLPALLDRLEAEGIYPIARIVVVKDPLLSAARPELAVQDTAGGVWIDSKEIVWLNLFNEDVWAYHVALAREVAEMGFPEIQWDYIRFPDAPESDLGRALFPGSEGRQRVEAVRGFLDYARQELADLPVRSTADVFGVTTSFSRDVGIGQVWETFIDVVDVALPMVYPSHYWEGSFGYAAPNAHPYEVVRAALRDARRRSARVDGAGLTRPWLQDFSLGQPPYGAPEVRAQIQAAYDEGIQEWILWNPSSRYTREALQPVDGFEVEPLVRVAGVLAPVSRRQLVIDSVAAVRLAAADSVARDSAGVGGSEGEIVVPEEVPVEGDVDTLSVPADTIMPEDTLSLGRPGDARPLSRRRAPLR